MYAGHGSVATPGVVPAFGAAQARFARLPWAELVAPAARAARRYPIGAATSRYLAYTANSLFGTDAEAHALVTRPDGHLLGPGESTSNPLLADVLDQLADEGPELFTTGAVAQALASDMQQRDGLITAADLAQYRPVTRPAHVSTVGRWRIGVNPPPAAMSCWARPSKE